MNQVQDGLANLKMKFENSAPGMSPKSTTHNGEGGGSSHRLKHVRKHFSEICGRLRRWRAATIRAELRRRMMGPALFFFFFRTLSEFFVQCPKCLEP